MAIILTDIDLLIIDLLDVPELTIMSSTNKFFYEIINKKPLYIQWFNSHTGNQIHTFTRICEYNYLEYAKWFLHRYPQFNIHHDGEQFFTLCCRYGHLDMAKWLLQWSKNNAEINIHGSSSNHFTPLTTCCIYDQLNIAKWLVELLLIKNIGVFYYNNNRFIYACEHGHLEIAQWLLNLENTNNIFPKINIHYHDDDAYFRSILNNHTHVTEWLLSLEPIHGPFQKFN